MKSNREFPFLSALNSEDIKKNFVDIKEMLSFKILGLGTLYFI